MLKYNKAAIGFFVIAILFLFNKIFFIYTEKNYCIPKNSALFNENLSELDEIFLTTMNNLFYEKKKNGYEKYSYEVVNLLLCDKNRAGEKLFYTLMNESAEDVLMLNTIAYISRSFPNRITNDNKKLFLEYINKNSLKIGHTNETGVIELMNDFTLFTNQLKALTELEKISVSDYVIDYLLKKGKIYETVLAIDFSEEKDFFEFKKRKNEVLPLLKKGLLSQELSDFERETILIFIEELEKS